MDLSPILPVSRPFLGDIYHSQIQHFQKTVVRRKYSLGFGDLSKLTVEPFNGIGRIYKCPDFKGIFEVGAQVYPVVFP